MIKKINVEKRNTSLCYSGIITDILGVRGVHKLQHAPRGKKNKLINQ